MVLGWGVIFYSHMFRKRAEEGGLKVRRSDLLRIPCECDALAQ